MRITTWSAKALFCGMLVLVGPTLAPGAVASQAGFAGDSLNIVIAEEAPGFGGFYQETRSERFYVYSSIESNDEAVLTAWRRHFGGDADAVIVRGRYDVRQLLTWQADIAIVTDGLWTSIGVVERYNQIQVGVSEPGMLDAFYAALGRHGIPAGAVRAVLGTSGPG